MQGRTRSSRSSSRFAPLHSPLRPGRLLRRRSSIRTRAEVSVAASPHWTLAGRARPWICADVRRCDPSRELLARSSRNRRGSR
jgi:hypothetical protein